MKLLTYEKRILLLLNSDPLIQWIRRKHRLPYSIFILLHSDGKTLSSPHPATHERTSRTTV